MFSLFSLLTLNLFYVQIEAWKPKNSLTSIRTPLLLRTYDTPTIEMPSRGFFSELATSLIGIKPIFSLMKLGARKVLIDTAEKNGERWREKSSCLEKNYASSLCKYYEEIVDKSVQYPSYYTQEFHAYDEGNLNWKAAYECESATMSMALRVFPNDNLSPKDAQHKLRYSILSAVKSYFLEKQQNVLPSHVIDVGCSVGISTFYLSHTFPDAKEVFGLDLSPYFLAVAKHNQNLKINDEGSHDESLVRDVESYTKDLTKEGVKKIQWVHSKAEETKFADKYFDVAMLTFMCHELPHGPTQDILREMYRIMKPGGVIAITDNDPNSPTIRNLPPVLWTLMVSTEPWSDDYYSIDMEQVLRNIGFVDVRTKSTDHRHRTVLARKEL